MPGDLEKVSPGEPITKNIVTAGTWNAFVDAALAHRAGKGKGPVGGPIDDILASSLKCLVKYDASSVSTLAAFSVLAYGAPLIDPATDEAARLLANKRPVFTGATPVSSSAPFVITTEPIQGTTLGHAVSHGLAVVQINMVNANHSRARAVVGSTERLESCTHGGVPIVYKESGTGDKWAMVLLDFSDNCCTTNQASTPTTQPLSCTIASGSGPGSGIEGVCCEVFLACDGAVTSICSGNTLTPYEVGEFTAACGDSMVVTYEICDTFDCPSALWYCQSTDTPCDRLFTSGNLCVNIKSGTRAYRAITSTGVFVTAFFTPGGWNLEYQLADTSGNTVFHIDGSLKWCTAAGVPGLYFFGTIRSTADDPDNPGTYPCGCFTKLDGCSVLTADGSEEITSGPTGTACELTGETLLITTPCGTLQMVVTSGLCTPPPPPPPPTVICTCSQCAGGNPGRWSIAANGTLPAIDALDYVSGCIWNGSSGGISATMGYDGSTWKVWYTGGGVTVAVYTISGGFNCCTTNTFNQSYIDPGMTGLLLSSISVTTAQSCTCPAPAATYDCVSGRCVDPGDGSGAYASLALCRAAPCDTLTAGKYYCTEPLIPGDPRVCLEGSVVGSSVVSSGPYDSLALCETGCSGSPGTESCCDRLVGKTATLTIPNGANAGTYTGTWVVGENFCKVNFYSLSDNTVLGVGPSGVWYANYNFTEATATLDTCADPVAIHTIPNSLFGGTGDAVVTTPI